MPGRLFLSTPNAEIAAVAGVDDGLPPQVPRFNVAPGQQVVTLTKQGLTEMRWGIIPVGRVNARGRPVMETLINARSETVFDKSAFDGMGRGVVPADGWYEWTGETRRKTAWRIRPRDGGLLWFAAITDVWDGPGGISVPQVATVTCPPNKDVKDVHHRMGVLLELSCIETWLSGTVEEARALMVPYPPGRLVIEPADDVDFDAA